MHQLQRSERHSGTGCLPQTPVVLHIYDLAKNETVQGVNSVLRAMGAGAFHAGVEVFGAEWSYGCQDQPDGSGVFRCPPKGCTDHVYRESLPMGMTTMTPEDVDNLLNMMRMQWFAGGYDLMHHNCCHFCDEFCKELGVDGLPFWVSLNISGIGASMRRMMKSSGATWSKHIDSLVGASIGVDPGFSENPADGLDRSILDGMGPRTSDPGKGPHRVPRGFDDGSGGWCQLGMEVDVFSISTQAWCRATVEGVQHGIVQLSYTPPGVNTGAYVVKELAVNDPSIQPISEDEDGMQQVHSYPSQSPMNFGATPSVIMPDFLGAAPPPAPTSLVQYVEGDGVEVFSNSFQMWCSGYVTHVSGDMVGVAFYWPGSDEPASKELHKDHGDLRPALGGPPMPPPSMFPVAQKKRVLA
mmetsp:Transcript_46208/g.84635  ORF Transcript_46208/g.84635 Transcript_46208/m.84635 type:complete len:411 (+) Transcript_46208:68-1300(+)